MRRGQQGPHHASRETAQPRGASGSGGRAHRRCVGTAGGRPQRQRPGCGIARCGLLERALRARRTVRPGRAPLRPAIPPVPMLALLFYLIQAGVLAPWQGARSLSRLLVAPPGSLCGPGGPRTYVLWDRRNRVPVAAANRSTGRSASARSLTKAASAQSLHRRGLTEAKGFCTSGACGAHAQEPGVGVGVVVGELRAPSEPACA